MSLVICNKCEREYDTDYEERCGCWGSENSIEDQVLEAAREKHFEEEDRVLSELADEQRSKMVGFGGEIGC